MSCCSFMRSSASTSLTNSNIIGLHVYYLPYKYFHFYYWNHQRITSDSIRKWTRETTTLFMHWTKEAYISFVQYNYNYVQTRHTCARWDCTADRIRTSANSSDWNPLLVAGHYRNDQITNNSKNGIIITRRRRRQNILCVPRLYRRDRIKYPFVQ